MTVTRRQDALYAQFENSEEARAAVRKTFAWQGAVLADACEDVLVQIEDHMKQLWRKFRRRA
ncbi:MAG TPA: hypothetical protein VNH41_01000 [Steroidobacteraceae bacterium]|nr:hypothetical protein [Steroidobacteraceae bacterium]